MKTKLGVTFYIFTILNAAVMLYMYIESLRGWFDSELHQGYKYIGYPKWFNIFTSLIIIGGLQVVIMVALIYSVANNVKLANTWLGLWMFCMLSAPILSQLRNSSFLKQAYKSAIMNVFFATFLLFIIMKNVPKLASIVAACVVAIFRIWLFIPYVQAFKRLPHVIEVDARGVTDSFWIICSQVIYPIVGSITVLLFMAWMLFPERFYKEKSDISI